MIYHFLCPQRLTLEFSKFVTVDVVLQGSSLVHYIQYIRRTTVLHVLRMGTCQTTHFLHFSIKSQHFLTCNILIYFCTTVQCTYIPPLVLYLHVPSKLQFAVIVLQFVQPLNQQNANPDLKGESDEVAKSCRLNELIRQYWPFYSLNPGFTPLSC